MSANAPTTLQKAALAAIAKLSRDALIEELQGFKGALKLDFTEEFLSGLSDDKLRHILLAVYLHGRPHRLPDMLNTQPSPSPVEHGRSDGSGSS